MRTIDEIEENFRRGITATVVPLQTTRYVDVPGLAQLVAWATEASVVLKGRPHLPRTFLNELYILSHVIRVEGEHNRDPQVREVADQLEMLFALILRGEVPGDRQAGVPRVL